MADDTKEHRTGLFAQAQHLRRVITKWKWMVSAVFFTCVTLAVLFSFLTDSVFAARGSIWVEDTANILPFEDVQSPNTGTSIEGHVRLLRSRTLAGEIITKLNLSRDPDFAIDQHNGKEQGEADASLFQELLIEHFLECLSVSPAQSATYERTQLIDVAYKNRNPQLAAKILNALFDGYVELLVRKRFAASEMATEFLTSQIAELRATIEQKEKEISQYGADQNILPLTAAEAPTIARMEDVNKELTAATIERVIKLNAYNQLKNAPLGEIPETPPNSLIKTLREQYITLSRQYAARLATVRPEYPEMQRLKTELDSATEALRLETQNLIRTAYNEYQAALKQEISLQNLLDDIKDKAYNTNSSSVVFNSLRIELDNKKALLEELSRRQSETDISSRLRGLEALNVWVVDRAHIPIRPISPNKRQNILLGIILGLAGGIGLALGLEYANQTVRTSKDVMASIGVPTLGSIPAFETETRSRGPFAEIVKMMAITFGKGERREAKTLRRSRKSGVRFLEVEAEDTNKPTQYYHDGKIELIVASNGTSIQAESFRSIRTTLLHSSPPGRIKTLLLTSPLAQEGKSSTVSNMAITLAESGRHVVVIDSDLRKPKQAKIFGLNNVLPGLSQYLNSDLRAEELARPTSIPNLHLVTSGPPPANPIELLTSERMDNLVVHLKRNFDFVLFDTPPLLAVSDAIALGPMADAIVLVVRAGQTPVQALKQAKERFDLHKLKCFGVILNDVDLIEQDGYYAKQYYNYTKVE